MRAPTPPDPRQLQLFHEIFENKTTSDASFDDPDGSWGTIIVPPPGKGWRVSDYSRDRRKTWARRMPVIPVQKIPGGRWRLR